YRTVCALFFFQAEDGIRDGHVTGVQTCAFRSPVSPRGTRASGPPPDPLVPWNRDGWDKSRSAAPRGQGATRKNIGHIRPRSNARSEERRVGKEGKERWGGEEEKKKGVNK